MNNCKCNKYGKEKEERKGQLLPQGEAPVQGVPKCVCKRCDCKV